MFGTSDNPTLGRLQWPAIYGSSTWG